MKKYDKMMDFLDDISGLPITAEIQDAFIKAWGKYTAIGLMMNHFLHCIRLLWLVLVVVRILI